MSGKMRTVFSLIACFLAFVLPSAIAQPYDQQLYFSVHGNIASQYIDGGLYKFSERYSTSVDSISDKELSIKNGFKFVRFEGGKKQETGEIEKINIVADGKLFVMFNNKKLHGDWTNGFYVIAQSEKDLESVKIQPITQISDEDEKCKKLILSYLQSERSQWEYEYFRSDSNFNINAVELSDKTQLRLIEVDGKASNFGYVFTAFVFPNEQVNVMMYARFIQAFNIQGTPYFLLRHGSPETGESDYVLYKFIDNKLITVFSDSGFST